MRIAGGIAGGKQELNRMLAWLARGEKAMGKFPRREVGEKALGAELKTHRQANPNRANPHKANNSEKLNGT